MLRKKEIPGFKGGFNLLDTYPLRFFNIIEKVSSDTTPGIFEFPPATQKIEHVVVNLCPTEPWALPNWAIFGHRVNVFFNKLKEIRDRFFPAVQYCIALNNKDIETIAAARNFAGSEERVRVFPLDAKYPQDDSVVLSKVVLGVDINFGQEAMSRGIFIMDAQTVSAIYDSCISGNKVDSRFIAVSGTGLKENELVQVQLGTPVEKVLSDRVIEGGKYRVFLNGPLRGKEITDLSYRVNWTINNIVVLREQDYKVMFPLFKSEELMFTTNVHGEVRRCVYCNFCDNICPVDLEPALYYHSYQRGERHKARLYNLERCIECGLCSFVCPSKLELLKIIRECK